MIPLAIRMKNFLSYRGETPVFDFTSLHIAVLSGENGAGKSSFLEAIHWAVWGKARLRESEIITLGETSMYVEFEFAVNHTNYRIHRSYTTSKRGGGKLELYQAHDDQRTQWSSLTKNSANETQHYIITHVVGMSYDVFANSAYLRQGRADAFTQLTPAERRDILAQILEIDVYEHYRERVKARRDVLRTEEVTLKTQMRNDEDNAATIPQLTQQLSDAEQRRDQALTFLTYAETMVSIQQTRITRNTTATQLHECTTTIAQLDRDITHNETVLAQRATVEAQYQQLCALEETARATRTQREQYDALTVQRQAITTRIARAGDALDLQIATLTQQIALIDDALSAHQRLREQHAQLRDAMAHDRDNPPTIADINDQRRTVQAAVAHHQQALQRMQAIRTEHARLQQRIDELDAVTAPWETLSARLSECETAQTRLKYLETQRIQQSDALSTIQAQRDIVKERGIEMRDKKALLTVDQPCPTCQTMMDEAHYAMALANFDNEIGQLREQYTALQQRYQQHYTQLQGITDEMASCAQLVDEMGSIRRTLGAIEAARNELTRTQSQYATLTDEYSSLASHDHTSQLASASATLAQLDTTYQAAVARHAQHAALVQQYAQIEAELQRLDQQAAQKVNAETQLAAAEIHRAQDTFAQEDRATLHDIEAQLAQLAYDPQADRATHAHIDALAGVRVQYNELAVLAERQIALVQRRHDAQHTLQQLTTTMQALDADIQRLQQVCDQLAPQLATRNLTVQPHLLKQQAETEISHRNEHVNQLTFKLSLANEAQLRLAPQQARLASIATDIQRHDVLDRAFSGRGIQAMIIRDHAVPALEYETNEILARMSDNQLHLHISTNTATQAGALRETIEINVSDATGTRQLEAFSGGEAFRISFALRIALSKLLHQRSGYPLETLIIDEGFGTQDANGRERLVEAINSISGDFRTILVITHIQELRDLFPVQISFRRVNGTSSWEIVA